MRTSRDCKRVCIGERDAKIKNRRTNATKKDLVVVLVCVVFLLVNLGAIGSGGRERAKRAVCLKNLKQLTLAWTQYADDNDGFLVNGEAFNGGDGTAPIPTGGRHAGERWWTGDDVGPGEQLPKEVQLQAIKAGALWLYCLNLKLYRCPTGNRGEMRHYTIVDSMNGIPRTGTIAAGVWIKNRMRIYKPGERAVFIDEGRVTPDSYATHYVYERWWDPPHVRHGEGTNLSFADGHSEYWKWKGKKMRDTGRMQNPTHQMVPETQEEKEDLYRMQRAVWGRLGYTPSAF